MFAFFLRFLHHEMKKKNIRAEHLMKWRATWKNNLNVIEIKIERNRKKETKTRNVRRNELENYCVSSLTANDCETGTSADFSFLLFLKNTRQIFDFLFTRAFFHLSSLMFSWKSHSQMENEIIQNDSYYRPFGNYTKMVYVLKKRFLGSNVWTKSFWI